jgi:hypothetical protein
MNKKNTIHGDVDLILINKLPKTAIKQNKNYNVHKRGTWIELGEHSGNAHVIAPTVGGIVNFYIDGEDLYTEVLHAPAIITHEEHAPLLIEIGIYHKKIEREYDPFTKVIKRVVD